MDTVPAPTAPNTPTVTVAPTAHAAIALQELGFPALNAALDDYLARTDGTKAGAWERWSLIAGVAGAGLAMLLGSALSGKAGVVATQLGLAVELLGLGTSLCLRIRREWRQFREARREHAREIEEGYTQYQQLVQQLRAFPLEQRRRRLHYIRDRRTTMHERLGLFTGGMERLGILPLLVALYLQFKDWRWGNWNAFANITLVQGAFAFWILVAYALPWYLVHLRARVQAYELLLAEANAQDGE
ncbi:hypothetical protein [Stenotrophomonas acidaminiphila]|uniref:hypothetical protein n=1 Tax=Stenotrophomonas acidaminiphila TaxID=128780 RepID=UPI0024AC9C91|nr:hypothetical protein [Stenotrophomonas acidaminiphila]WHL18407.1 hypothetical protein QLF99_15315 [Stenotrophomonas acidaminiphila]